MLTVGRLSSLFALEAIKASKLNKLQKWFRLSVSCQKVEVWAS